MSRRAQPLHEEVVAAMYAEQVDPFERNFHSSHDRMKDVAIFREQNAEPVPSYKSTNLDFWKGFNKNQKYLQAKSAADIRKQARAKKPRKKINPLLVNRGKPQPVLQDQKTPARDLTCKFPPPPLGGKEDGLVYEVQDLMTFADRKNCKGYKPKSLEVIDPLQAEGGGFDEFGRPRGVVYKYNPEEDPNYVPPTGQDRSIRTRGGSRVGSAPVKGVQEQSGQLGGDSDIEGGQGSFWRSEELGLASGLVVGEQDSHVLPESTSSPSAPQQLAESSSALDKPSIVSASGTVVPSLNLSNVIASQISKSEKSKQEKGVENTDDDNTAGDNTFGFDDNTNELDQQPSFAFTDNEDFLFQKSMMDGTMATNTVMDDLTKQSTAAPSRKKSAKERRKQAQARNRRKKLLAPVSGVHGDIGTAVPGGQMNQEPARPKPDRGYTQTCSFPSVEELDAAGRKPKGGTFPFAKRFPTVSASAGKNSGGGGGAAVCPALPTKKKPDKGAFSETKRFTSKINESPAPGDYNLRRMFEDVATGKGKQLTAETSHALVLKIEEERILRNQSCNYMSNQAVFGYGCSVEEHVKYGLCLDGQCGRRAKWEDVMLLKQDHGRLGHGGGLELSPKKSLSSRKTRAGNGALQEPSPSINMTLSKKTFDIIDDLRGSLQDGEKPDFSPLKTASLRGDFDTVVQLCLLGADINERDRLEQTIMHQAVLRNYLHIIVCLTEVVGYSECLDDKLKAICRDKSRGMFVGVVDLDAQDLKGNTPLHIASMRGNSLMAEVLCDAGANPDGIRNNEGCTSSDIAKTQRLFQIIKMAQAKYEAETVLNTLIADRRSLKKQVVAPNGNEEEEEDEEEEEEFEVYEEDDDYEDENKEEEEEAEEENEKEKEEKEGVTLLPVSKHANKQHSYYVSYFGTPQEPKKKQSEREKFARFLKMRR